MIFRAISVFLGQNGSAPRENMVPMHIGLTNYTCTLTPIVHDILFTYLKFSGSTKTIKYKVWNNIAKNIAARRTSKDTQNIADCLLHADDEDDKVWRNAKKLQKGNNRDIERVRFRLRNEKQNRLTRVECIVHIFEIDIWNCITNSFIFNYISYVPIDASRTKLELTDRVCAEFD